MQRKPKPNAYIAGHNQGVLHESSEVRFLTAEKCRVGFTVKACQVNKVVKHVCGFDVSVFGVFDYGAREVVERDKARQVLCLRILLKAYMISRDVLNS